MFKQCLGQRIERLDVSRQDRSSFVVSKGHEPFNFRVDRHGDTLGVVGLVLLVLPQEDLTLVLSKPAGPNRITHAVFGDHGLGQGGHTVDVVGRARCRITKDHFLGRPSTEQHRQVVMQLRAGAQVAILFR